MRRVIFRRYNSDSEHFATIGIGVNLTVPGNLALVLETLGVFNASQTVSKQEALVSQFETIMQDHPISPPAARTSTAFYSASETALQNVLDAALQAIPGFSGK